VSNSISRRGSESTHLDAPGIDGREQIVIGNCSKKEVGSEKVIVDLLAEFIIAHQPAPSIRQVSNPLEVALSEHTDEGGKVRCGPIVSPHEDGERKPRGNVSDLPHTAVIDSGQHGGRLAVLRHLLLNRKELILNYTAL
jgi:hypothetical protein